MHIKTCFSKIQGILLLQNLKLMDNLDEMRYLEQIEKIIQKGTIKADRTGTGTISIFGMQTRYELRNGILPLLTTKKISFRVILEELLWFIRGDTNTKTLSDKGVKIWDANGSRKFLDQCGFFDRDEGDLGPVYGFQWRHSGAKYKDCRTDYSGQGIDQLSQIIELIKNEPNSRRIILCAWNPKDLPMMALPPCHTLCQFYVNTAPRDGGIPELSCQLYQRSGDMGLGVPFNIASYSLLTHMIANVTRLRAAEFVHTLGDAHIYLTHLSALKEQLKRRPRPFPKIKVAQVNCIDKFTFDCFQLQNYNPYPSIKMEMAL